MCDGDGDGDGDWKIALPNYLIFFCQSFIHLNKNVISGQWEGVKTDIIHRFQESLSK